MLRVMNAGCVYCFRVISKAGQATGLRDLNGECSLSPYLLWAGSAGETGVPGISPSTSLIRAHALLPYRSPGGNRGQHPAAGRW